MLNPRYDETAQFLRQRGFDRATAGLILGTGFGRFVDHLTVDALLPYPQIPHFPVSTVPDHAGNLVCGRLQGLRLLIMQGRFHRYEGYPPSAVTFPVGVMHRLGITTLIVTNAAGGLNPGFVPGDLMVVDDHLVLMGGSALTGLEDEVPRSIPSYSRRLNDMAFALAAADRMPLRRGVLAWMLGPAFETPAEIAMLGRAGADAVTMSTIPEVAMASALGMQVMGISCIANMCVGADRPPVTHEDVMATVGRAVDRFSDLMRRMLPMVCGQPPQKGDRFSG
ncbi:MAG: purine-nucleoside phosphorylase [Candidatus Latescibacteria bacterium]|nr:purine-nucleoside phosphorylase [Candidatus Latescibacterota bacterium]